MQKNEKENNNKILLNSKVCSTVQGLLWDVGVKTFSKHVLKMWNSSDIWK
jgi:hypothetical protein